ncbi:uncharacterized protein LOC135837061 isoform X2 [Planococcus citri]|uniref:uncharacterized protein LOC135837061 isoform X2 n=1 Tax=Planococcus citri TaxID=170843 RepID=UPI0031F982F2
MFYQSVIEMNSTRKILVFLLFNLNVLFFLGSNSVSAFGGEPLTPGIAIRSGIRAAIEKTSKILGSWKPLTIFTPLKESCLANLTSQSLDVKILTPETVSTMTGGIFGKDVYEFYKFSLYWKIIKSCNTTSLESRVYYVNLKYGSFQEASRHEDGVVVMNFPVDTYGDFDNPVFAAFSALIQHKLKRPGDCTNVLSASTYTWYVTFPYGSIYNTYKADFIDDETGKKYTATVINLPLDPRVNYISKQQFAATFGNLKGVNDVEDEGTLLQDTSNAKTPIERHQGVCVLNLPA